ncbi:hypothetical protein [Arcobacter sp.]|uniref:hypothetical protein n=1 Tax=Arcobacter sp. TaxID=1872629 RepID=UPI003D1027CD
MMKRNKILLAGKKVIKGLLVSSIVLASSEADFLMTLTDKAGVEENLCVKSYSFSNNMESLHKEVKQMKDVYSTEETLTNKIWMGKPVYRKILKIDNFVVPASGSGIIKYSNESIDAPIENIVSNDFHAILDNRLVISSMNTKYAIYNDGRSYLYAANFFLNTKKASIAIRNDRINSLPWSMSDIRVIVEYTKTTDTAQTDTNELTTLVHYLPSDSTTGEYITKSMDDAIVGFKKNYTYDTSTNSCIAPVN